MLKNSAKHSRIPINLKNIPAKAHHSLVIVLVIPYCAVNYI